MKKLSAFVCAVLSLAIGPAIVFLTLSSTVALADDAFKAKLQDDGKYCARVELEGPGAMRINKTKCRTLEQWKQAGYDVKTLDGSEVEI